MKRIRRIEIVRYTRRVGLVQGGSAPADSDGLPAVETTPAAPEGEVRQRDAVEAVELQKPQRPPAFELRNLLRPRR